MKKVFILLLIILIMLGIFFFTKGIRKIYYEIEPIEEYNYFKYLDGGKYGIIDRSGKVLIDAIYTDIIIPNPEKGIFICYDNEKKITLDSANNKIFAEYDEIEPIKLKNIISVFNYEKSLLKYKKDGKFGLIDFNGKEITKNVYDSIENLQSTEGKFLVKKDEKYGIVNLNGTVIVDTKYDEIRTDGFYDMAEKYVKAGFITGIKTDEGYRYGYVRYDGKQILKEEFYDIERILTQDEIYIIVAKDGRYGLYRNSKKIIDTDYQNITYTENGGLIIQKDKKLGIAGMDGKIVLEPKYATIEEKGIYLYASNLDEHQVYDINGERKSMNFDKAVYECEGSDYRIVTLTNNNITRYGIEDGAEKTLIDPTYNYLEYISENYFIAKNDDGKLGIINTNGRNMIDFKYDVIQKIKGKNIIQTIEHKTNTTELYSEKLTNIAQMQMATTENFDGYILIYNDEQKLYFDAKGNKIGENSEILKNAKLKNFEDNLGEYKKVQTSLDNVYYEKKDV